MEYEKEDVKKFLIESNGIERCYDDISFKQAVRAWNFLSKQKVLTKSVILKTHKILSLHSRLLPGQKGHFRKVKVWVAERETLGFAKIPNAIKEWLKDANDSIKNPGENGENIRLDHIKYEKIHPFVDFNGRTGRLFMNWQRMQAGLPILIIKADWPDYHGEQRAYYMWFGK
jgi:Fic family protein